MLASTIQISNNNPTPDTTHPRVQHQARTMMSRAPLAFLVFLGTLGTEAPDAPVGEPTGCG